MNIFEHSLPSNAIRDVNNSGIRYLGNVTRYFRSGGQRFARVVHYSVTYHLTGDSTKIHVACHVKSGRFVGGNASAARTVPSKSNASKVARALIEHLSIEAALLSVAKRAPLASAKPLVEILGGAAPHPAYIAQRPGTGDVRAKTMDKRRPVYVVKSYDTPLKVLIEFLLAPERPHSFTIEYLGETLEFSGRPSVQWFVKGLEAGARLNPS